MHRLITFFIYCFLLCGCILVCCGVVEKLQNKEPVIKSITASRYKIAPNDTTTLMVKASDADNDELTYTWNHFNHGRFVDDNVGDKVVWEAPQKGQNYTIEVTVNDPHDGKATGQIELTVISEDKPIVEIISPTSEQYLVGYGVQTIKANASHENGIDRVEFYIDDVHVGTDNLNRDREPYEYNWKLDGLSGNKEIKAVAFGRFPNVPPGADSIVVNVQGVTGVPF